MNTVVRFDFGYRLLRVGFVLTVLALAAPTRGTVPQCITCPPDIVVNSSTARTVMYMEPTPTAGCPVNSSNVMVTCTPPPGSLFQVGTTLVTCEAKIGTIPTNRCTFNVTVGTIPVISIQPRSTNVLNRSSATFSVRAIAVPSPTYQWRFNGVRIPNATNFLLTIPEARIEDSGNYFAVVSNVVGVVTSTAARLTVVTPALVAPLIRAGSVWNYLYNGSAAPPNWRLADFDDADWSAGAGELGFGDDDGATVIGSPTNGFITAYFRRPFTMDIPQSVSNLVLHLRRDDGAVAYLNGVEVFRSNMPTGAITYFTLASSVAADDGNTVYSTNVNPELLRPGVNLLAVEVHQRTANNVDLSFEAELISCPVDPAIPCGPPVIEMQPQHLTLSNGDSAEFSVMVPDTPPMGFQWLFNGTNLPGATAATLTIARAAREHQGLYRVRVTNAFGVTLSDPASLTVFTPAHLGPLVPTGAAWRHLFNGAAPPTAWRRAPLDDSGWSSGAALLGFGDNPATVIGSATNRYITAYFRRAFDVPIPQAVSNLVLNLRRDDGAIVYLNEVEIFRSNMPTGAITHLTLAAGETLDDGRMIHSTTVDPGTLVAGMNLLAVEVHQWLTTSSDLSFDLSLVSCAGGEATLDIATFGRQIIVRWDSPGYRLQGAIALPGPGAANPWTTLPDTSPAAFVPAFSPYRFFRLTCQ